MSRQSSFDRLDGGQKERIWDFFEQMGKLDAIETAINLIPRRALLALDEEILRMNRECEEAENA